MDENNARKVVNRIEGLYDEKSEAVLMNINARNPTLRCLLGKHDFINASLYWSKNKNRSIDISSPGYKNKDGKIYGAFGIGYGGIRYCRQCKTIDCIHYWDEKTEYAVQHGRYFAEVYDVAVCGACNRRVLRGSFGEMKPSPEAWALIEEVARKLGRRSPSPGSGYGSAWMLEFPVAVSRIIDDQGVKAAELYAESTFLSGDCQSAITAVSARR